MLTQKTRITKYRDFANGETSPTLCQMQRIIGEMRPFEPEANMLLRSAKLPEVAGYLAFTYFLNLDTEFIPDYDLGKLLLLAIHSELLNQNIRNLDIREVKEELRLSKHNELTDNEFKKITDFIDIKVLPHVIERNYQSLAFAMINSVINPYAAFDHRIKSLLRSHIHQIANIGQLQYQQRKKQDDILQVKMRGERQTGAINTSLERIIEELRGNWRVEHPTKFEQLLTEFRDRDFQPMQAEEIAQLLFTDSEVPERAVQFMISKLNSKLEGTGLKIERFSSYELQRAGNSEE